ncbi:MAG: NADH-quinone oxidoreductase subunit J [Leptospira sp.]|nr:NADH-quinone oxidoreductase subunit J [Leptospira sp.]
MLDFDSLQSFLFYFFAGVTVASALGVVLHRNPISAAVLLVLTFFSLAAIYATIGAIFIATMQVLVYAGAIMVLVVFVLMLLSLKTENISKLWDNPPKKIALFLTVGLLLLLISMGVSIGVPHSKVPTKGVDSVTGEYVYEIAKDQTVTGNVAVVGAHTFIEYLLPFEMIAILLLVAVIGAVILAKKKEVV